MARKAWDIKTAAEQRLTAGHAVVLSQSPGNRRSRRSATRAKRRKAKAKATTKGNKDDARYGIGGNFPPEPIEPPQKRAPGRPKGAKNKPKPRSVDSPYLTIDEFCARFCISRATYTQRHRHYLRTVKFGGRSLIPVGEAERYAASLAHEPSRHVGDSRDPK